MADYYVSTSGADANLGTSEQSPWKTIGHVNNQVFQPGDTIHFKRGDIWRGNDNGLPVARLSISGDGTAAEPIRITDYGIGLVPATISGGRKFNSWSWSSPNWYDGSVSTKPAAFYDRHRTMTEVDVIGDLDVGKWWWDEDNGRVYIQTFEGDAPTTHDMEGAVGAHAVRVTTNWLVVDKILIEKGSDANMEVRGADNTIISGVLSRLSASYGFWSRSPRTTFVGCQSDSEASHAYYIYDSFSTTGCNVISCTGWRAGGDGLRIESANNYTVDQGEYHACTGNGITLLNCTDEDNQQEVKTAISHDNTGDGILVQNTKWARLQACKSYDNGGEGIELSTGSEDTVIRYCTANGNTGAGLKVGADVEDTKAYYSILYDNDIGLEYTDDPSSGNVFDNMVIYSNATTGVDLTGNTSGDYKIYVPGPDSETGWATFENELATLPAFDGFNGNMQNINIRAHAAAICTARPELYFWQYYSMFEYPFSAAAGQAENTWANWFRSNIQFDGGGATVARMICGAGSTDVGCYNAYCTGPSAGPYGEFFSGAGPDIEYYEIVHWQDINDAACDSISTKMFDLADDIHATKGGIFLDQGWCRPWSWHFSAAAANYQSGHGATEEVGNYTGIDYDFASGPDATFGTNNWAAHRLQTQYFWNKVAADTPSGTWVITNGDLRGHGTSAAASGNGGDLPPYPMYIENYSDPQGGTTVEDVLVMWGEDTNNVLEMRLSANWVGDIQTLLTRWDANGGGWVALDPGSVGGWFSSTHKEAWQILADHQASKSTWFATVRNSVIVGNPTGMLFDHAAAGAGHVITNNCYYDSSTAAVNADGTLYSVQDIDDGTYYAATGFDLDSIGKPPDWEDAPDNFRPTSVSELLNAGTDVGLIRDFYGTTVPIQDIPDMGVAEVSKTDGEIPDPDPLTVEERLALAKIEICTLAQACADEAVNILRGSSEQGFQEAFGLMAQTSEQIAEACRKLEVGSPEPPPDPPDPPEPPTTPPRKLPALQGRFADLIGLCPGFDAWDGWGVSPEGIATIEGYSTAGLIRGSVAQAVKPLPQATYWPNATVEVTLDRITLTRPSSETLIMGVASYGGQFVPNQKIIPNVPLPTNPYVNLAPTVANLAEESIILKVVSPQSDGVTLSLTNTLNFKRKTTTVDIREAGVFTPGFKTKIELVASLTADFRLIGTVRFANLATSDTENLGVIHKFEFGLIDGTATPFVWGMLGPVKTDGGAWVEFNNPVFSSWTG